jgi:glycosyltransferase involved in cell wall biosynthesis
MEMNSIENNKKRVLMVLGSLKFGGAEILCLSILKNIDRTKFQIDFAVTELTNSEIEKEVRTLGSQIFVFPRFKVLNKRHFKNSWASFFERNQYDIVHGHASGAMSLYLSIAKKHGCKTIAHSHSGSFTGNIFVRQAKKYYSHRIIQNSDYLIACSHEAARNLFGKKYKTLSNYSFVPNGIDVDLFAFNTEARETLRKKLNIPQDTILFGHVGRFISVKNHMFLLDIFHKIIKKNKNARLLLCGE